MNDEIKEMMEQMESIAITGKNKNGIKVDGYGLQQNGLKILLDYITNLQQENERLKTIKPCMLNFQECYVVKDYKSRCEKAIEYNKEIVDNYLKEDNCEYCDGRYATAKHNLNILQNGSDTQ